MKNYLISNVLFILSDTFISVQKCNEAAMFIVPFYYHIMLIIVKAHIMQYIKYLFNCLLVFSRISTY